jgi:hypothetical protein
MSRLSLQPIFTNFFDQGDTSTSISSGLSHRLWSKVRAHGSGPDGSAGIFVADDFLLFGESVAASSNIACFVSQAGQYKAYIDTTSTLAQLATVTGGAIALTTEAADNEELSICQGGAGTAAATSVLGALNRDTGPKLTIFESRFKVSSITDDVQAIFVGLMEENGAVHNAKVDDTGATIDNDYIGFETVHTNGGTTGANAALRAVYKKDGQTAQTSISGIATLAADTWIKAGFVYDPTAPASKRIAWYVNNVEQTSAYVTDTQMDAATFPDGEEMGFTAITKSGTATASSLTLDWWAFYQEL